MSFGSAILERLTRDCLDVGLTDGEQGAEYVRNCVELESRCDNTLQSQSTLTKIELLGQFLY